jgi:hypothetical protein
VSTIIRITSNQPQPKHAELTIWGLGKAPDLTVETMRVAGEIEGRQFMQLRSGRLPLTIALAGVYYDQESPLVRMLHEDGARFKIEVYSWVCPVEIRDDSHWCTGQCSTVQIVETVQ